jgi:cyanate lyase
MTREETTALILETIRDRELTIGGIAAEIGRPKVWTAAAIYGQHPFDEDSADALAGLLGLPDEAKPALREIPSRGALEQPIPTDPTLYRLYEVLQVYGPALKALIHEEFGDGIMSAITFNMDVEREEHDEGDRVKITMSGKFLPYKW